MGVPYPFFYSHLMNEKEILIKAANIIDDTPVKITYETVEEKVLTRYKYSFLGYEFGKFEEIEINPKQVTYLIAGAKLRTMIRVSKLIMQMTGVIQPQNVTADWIFSLVLANTEIVAKIIATAIHNQKSEVPYALVDELIDNLNSEDLQKIMVAVVDKLMLAPFMSTIASVRSMQMMEKTEPETSPQEQKEIIASGEQLEALQNIFGSATIKS